MCALEMCDTGAKHCACPVSLIHCALRIPQCHNAVELPCSLQARNKPKLQVVTNVLLILPVAHQLNERTPMKVLS